MDQKTFVELFKHMTREEQEKVIAELSEIYKKR